MNISNFLIECLPNYINKLQILYWFIVAWILFYWIFVKPVFIPDKVILDWSFPQLCSTLWNIRPCNAFKMRHSFRRWCNKQSFFMFGLICSPEHGSDMYLRTLANSHRITRRCYFTEDGTCLQNLCIQLRYKGLYEYPPLDMEIWQLYK